MPYVTSRIGLYSFIRSPCRLLLSMFVIRMCVLLFIAFTQPKVNSPLPASKSVIGQRPYIIETMHSYTLPM